MTQDTMLAKTTTTVLVPPGIPIAPDDWAAMSEQERSAALAFFRDEQDKTTEGLEITFPRVKYPTAGASFWEVPTATGEPEAVKELTGVVIYKQPVRAYWPIEQEVGKNPPLCSSLDGSTPTPSQTQQALTCATCPHAQWGSGKDGRGQGCKQRLNLFLLRPGEEIPTLLSLPPTAIKPFSQYAVQLRKGKSALIAVTTTFGLTKATSGGGIEYKALTLRVGRPLAYSEMRQARAIGELFEEAMAKRGIRIEEAEEETNGHGEPA